jgi:hypothetical protein
MTLAQLLSDMSGISFPHGVTVLVSSSTMPYAKHIFSLVGPPSWSTR